MHSPSGSGSLLSNTIANPRGDLKAITTRSGVAYEGPSIPPTSYSLPKEVERESEVTKDKVQTTSSESTAHVQPPVVQIPISKPEVVLKPNPKTSIPYHSRLNNQKLQEKMNNQKMKDKDFSTYPDEPSNLDDDYCDTEGDILYLEKLLNEDPSPNLPTMKNKDLKQVDVTMINPSIKEPPELKLKDLPPHLEYAFLEGTDKLPVIISKELKDEEKAVLLKVLKSHKRAIAWKISNIKGIDPRFCTHKILIEDDFKPVVQHQRMVNPKIHEVIKKEVIKLLDAGLIYPISDSPWVSLLHCVPKKGGMTVVENEDNELIPTRLVTGWRVCIDYRNINDTICKDHFPLPFMDQMLKRLAGNGYYCFLDRFWGYFQIPIDP
nr:reverse transcriptase domain-containing protein [Tanacetum cinerariifolium]